MNPVSDSFLSIGMPVYNGERHIRQALDSLLTQTFGEFELIISDNASTDGTAAICAEYAALDARIRIIRQEYNFGAPRNWNLLVHEARGGLFKWASGNDCSTPQTLALCVEAMRSHPDVVMCYGRTELIDDDGRSLGLYDGDLDIGDDRASVRFETVMKDLALNNAHQGVFRTDVLRRTGLARLYPGGDIPLMAELALHGRLLLLPEVLLRRRFAMGSLMAMKSHAEVSRIYDPQARRPAMFHRSRVHKDNLVSIFRAPISLSEKIRSWVIALKFAIWERGRLWREIRASVPIPPRMDYWAPCILGPLLGWE